MVNKLSLFEGYFIDIKLRQFRIVKGEKIKFIDFESIRGEKILNKYIQSLKPNSRTFRKIVRTF